MAVLVCEPTSQGEVWSGDWGPYCGTLAVNQYPNHAIAATPTTPARYQKITGVSTPTGLGQYAQLLCLDADVSPRTPTVNPRCQLNSPFCVQEGAQVRYRGEILMNYLPTFASGFFEITEIYQSPYTTSPAMALYIQPSTSCLMLENNVLIPFQKIWISSSPITVGVPIVWEIRASMSADPTLGWLELSVAMDGTDNVVSQQLSNPGGGKVTRLPCATIIPGGSNAAVYPGPYRTVGMESESIVQYAGYRIDTLS